MLIVLGQVVNAGVFTGAGAKAGPVCQRQSDTAGRLRQLREVPLPHGRCCAALLQHASTRSHQLSVSAVHQHQHPLCTRVAAKIFCSKTYPGRFLEVLDDVSEVLARKLWLPQF